MANDLKALSDQIADNKRESSLAFINEMHGKIVDSVKINTMPETIFKNRYLDFFRAGGVDKTLRLEWIGIAGSPYTEVDVVDKDNVVIFRVPGILAKHTLDTSDMDLGKVMSDFVLRSNRTPQEGINYLNGKIGGLGNNIKSVGKDENSNTWKMIFAHYDAQEQAAAIPSGIKKVKTGSNSNIGDYIDYD